MTQPACRKWLPCDDCDECRSRLLCCAAAPVATARHPMVGSTRTSLLTRRGSLASVAWLAASQARFPPRKSLIPFPAAASGGGERLRELHCAVLSLTTRAVCLCACSDFWYERRLITGSGVSSKHVAASELCTPFRVVVLLSRCHQAHARVPSRRRQELFCSVHRAPRFKLVQRVGPWLPRPRSPKRDVCRRAGLHSGGWRWWHLLRHPHRLWHHFPPE